MRILTICICFLFLLIPNLFSIQKDGFVYDKGTEIIIVRYKKYGKFIGLGTENYKYIIKKMDKLADAVGEGIYPNETSISKNPLFKARLKEGLLAGNHWDFLKSDDFDLNYFKWATANEDKGVKLFYTALMLEKSGEIERAIKAYYALLVHFPKTIGWTHWQTPWLIGPVAINRIHYLTRIYPQLGLKLKDAKILVKNSYDNDIENDIFIVNPGILKKVKPSKIIYKSIDLNKLKVVEVIGAENSNVKLKKYENRHWQLFVNDEPFVIKGITYTPNKIGLSPDVRTLDVNRDWMFADNNNNRIIDAPFESWVDENKNNIQDTDEKNVGDFELMKEMGVNTLRLYHYANLNKELLQKGYDDYGFMYLMGNFIGMYAVDSGADWNEGTDYTNSKHLENMLKSVIQMVEEYKDKPYILMWVLGNENNYAEVGRAGFGGSNAKSQPEAYYKFVNKAAELIKSLDPQKRPVAICNGDLLFFDVFAKYTSSVDVFGANSYRGESGFGNLWIDVQYMMDKPVFITEYGCSAYHSNWDREQSEIGQAKYLKGNWLDIQFNVAGLGVGNSLGGVVFEWIDEWWKAGHPPEFDPSVQEKIHQFRAPFLDGWSYEEFLGITSQGDGLDSPFMRQLRPSYYIFKELWGE